MQIQGASLAMLALLCTVLAAKIDFKLYRQALKTVTQCKSMPVHYYMPVCDKAKERVKSVRMQVLRRMSPQQRRKMIEQIRQG